MEYELKEKSGKLKFWSKKPGVYIDQDTSEPIPPEEAIKAGAPFFFDKFQWNKGLAELIRNISRENSGKGVIVTSRGPHLILEHLLCFRAKFAYDNLVDKGKYTHGELNFQDSVVDEMETVRVYFDKTIVEGGMYYVTDEGIYTPIIILDMEQDK